MKKVKIIRTLMLAFMMAVFIMPSIVFAAEDVERTDKPEVNGIEWSTEGEDVEEDRLNADNHWEAEEEQDILYKVTTTVKEDSEEQDIEKQPAVVNVHRTVDISNIILWMVIMIVTIGIIIVSKRKIRK